MSNKVDDKKKKILEAAYIAVDELVMVLRAPILGKSGIDEDVAAEKMKNAAAAKKLAMFDALEMMDKAQDLEEDLNGVKTVKVKVEEEKKTDFRSAEERARK